MDPSDELEAPAHPAMPAARSARSARTCLMAPSSGNKRFYQTVAILSRSRSRHFCRAEPGRIWRSGPFLPPGPRVGTHFAMRMGTTGIGESEDRMAQAETNDKGTGTCRKTILVV